MADNSYTTVCNFISNLNNLLWGIGIFALIVSIGIYFTIRIKLYNILHFVDFFKDILSNSTNNSHNASRGKISHFQALSTALAASMGTGNIIGVSTAITLGGPGAIFWMWISGLIGTSIGFLENVLGHIYKSEGSGPMGYITKAFNSPRAAFLYSLLCIGASFGIGNLTQSNALSSAAGLFNIPCQISGAISAVIVALIIFNGAKKVASAAEKLVPFVACIYLIGTIIVITYFGDNIIEILTTILKSAFGFDQISGGISAAILKKSIAIGLRRGIFSNESGLGTSVLIHSEAETNSPVEMGKFAIVEIFIDTIVCCTATAFVILLSGAHTSGTEGLAQLTLAFSQVIGRAAPFFVSSVTIIFAFCTLIGWYFYGEKCIEYAFKTGNSKTLLMYRFMYTCAVYAGAVAQLQLVWEIADILNWIMLVLNLTAVFILHNKAIKVVNDYTNSINIK